jgi:tetratricopeptide (TPR) repeat protein
VAAFLLAIFGRQLRRTEGERAFYLALALLITPLLPAFYLCALEPGNFLHDRYLYMPVAGFALLIALAFQKLACNMPALVRPMLVAFCGMALSYALSSMVEAQVWKSDFSLFTRGAQVAPENMVVKSNLASELIRQQRCADAVPLLEQVVQRAPEMWFAHANLGNCYLEAGRGAQAEDELSIAVQLQPLPELVQRLHMLRARH